MKALASLLALPLLILAVAAFRVSDSHFDNRLPAPVTDSDYYDNGAPAEERVELGRMLFFDKILSGNKNISCATCHSPDFGSGDGVSLGFGEGATGQGPERTPGNTKAEGVHERVPRNAPALFNLGAREFTRFFHDGRVEVDTQGYYEGGFITPAKWKLHIGLDNVLAAQAMFPVTSPAEMAGQKGENSIADARSLNNVAGKKGVWEQLARRLQENDEYVELFKRAFPDEVKEAGDITMVLAANAIASFETKAFRADNSDFDTYLRTGQGLTEGAKRGMDLFYGKANCQWCHSGKFQTDHEFHAIAMPQIGPGKSDGNHPAYWRETGQQAFVEDFGRGRVTVREQDAFKFRTPSLRNVTLTGPWGHSGAYLTLEEVVRHHLNPVQSLHDYELDHNVLPQLNGVLETTADGPRLLNNWLSDQRLQDFLKRDGWVQSHPELRQRIADANELRPVELSDREVDDVLMFLESLTDTTSMLLFGNPPDRVPSGLPVLD